MIFVFYILYMDIKIENYLDNPNNKFDSVTVQKMILLFNAIEDGWTVKKRKDTFVFTRKHEGKQEVMQESYLFKFVKHNLDITKLINDKNK
jgi:hypothetical protein